MSQPEHTVKLKDVKSFVKKRSPLTSATASARIARLMVNPGQSPRPGPKVFDSSACDRGHSLAPLTVQVDQEKDVLTLETHI